jgi:hypothetical protein
MRTSAHKQFSSAWSTSASQLRKFALPPTRSSPARTAWEDRWCDCSDQVGVLLVVFCCSSDLRLVRRLAWLDGSVAGVYLGPRDTMLDEHKEHMYTTIQGFKEARPRPFEASRKTRRGITGAVLRGIKIWDGTS